MTDRELLEKAIYWFRIIAEDMERITSGNLSYNAATTKGRAIRAYEFLEKHKNDTPIAEDLEEAAKADAMIERSDDTEIGYDLNRYSGFIAGAKWKEQQFEKNRLKHCEQEKPYITKKVGDYTTTTKIIKKGE